MLGNWLVQSVNQALKENLWSPPYYGLVQAHLMLHFICQSVMLTGTLNVTFYMPECDVNNNNKSLHTVTYWVKQKSNNTHRVKGKASLCFFSRLLTYLQVYVTGLPPSVRECMVGSSFQSSPWPLQESPPQVAITTRVMSLQCLCHKLLCLHLWATVQRLPLKQTMHRM